MSGFSPDWLDLREPADHSAINLRLRRKLQQAIARCDAISVIDLGCGSGSNFRALAPDIVCEQQWMLVDHDPALLEHAHELLAAADSPVSNASWTTRQADFADGDIGELTKGADLVTAAALFDLISPGIIERMVGQIASEKAVFYTTLTYDGIASWLPFHRADQQMLDAFNAHQRTDKGFGHAAGPDATRCLREAFLARGYTVEIGRSPWVLGVELLELRREVDRGWAAAVRETGTVSEADVSAWLAHRETAEQAVTIVGHLDMLALPSK